VDQALNVLQEYARLYEPERDRTDAYRRTLTDQPWKRCECAVCRSIGIDVVIFRGAERNRRRGFHNLRVLYLKLQRELRDT